MGKVKNSQETVLKNKISVREIAENDDLDSKIIFDNLKEHSNNLDETKNEINKLRSKKLFKEKALASIQRETELDQAKASDIGTFIVPILYTVIGILFGSNIVSYVLFILLLFMMSVFIYGISKCFENKNDIKLFRLIKFIEDLDTSEETDTYHCK